MILHISLSDVGGSNFSSFQGRLTSYFFCSLSCSMISLSCSYFTAAVSSSKPMDSCFQNLFNESLMYILSLNASKLETMLEAPC